LILDEPTNHLDIDSRRALMEALNDYEGAVLLITHDRSLMEMVADRLWLAADGTIKAFEGDMEDYARFVLDRARLAARAESEGLKSGPAAPSAKDARKASAEARARLAPLKRAVEAIEKRMDQLTRKIADADSTLADPALFSKDPARAVALGKARAEAAAGLETAELEWMEAAEAYEAAKLEAGV
jgi:ATP-binding cassette subfamily F protein 3